MKAAQAKSWTSGLRAGVLFGCVSGDSYGDDEASQVSVALSEQRSTPHASDAPALRRDASAQELLARACCVPGCPEIAVHKQHFEAHQPKPKERQPKAK